MSKESSVLNKTIIDPVNNSFLSSLETHINFKTNNSQENIVIKIPNNLNLFQIPVYLCVLSKQNYENLICPCCEHITLNPKKMISSKMCDNWTLICPVFGHLLYDA